MAPAAAHDKLTPQQHDAVTRRQVSVVLSSGAGCGKTHVLTRRYLSHLEDDGAEVGQIVAITFTDRAARQMRDRIRGAILSHLERADTPEASRRWEEHLRGLETAQISTIHAFCAALLRQHAVEAGLDPRFDVLQEFLAVNLEEEALTDCLQRLLTAESQPGEDLRELILLYGWKPVVEVTHRLMAEDDAALRERWLHRTPADIAAQWETYASTELLPRHVAWLSAASPRVARCLWLLRTTPCLGPKMAANVATLLEKTPRLAEVDDLATAVEELTAAATVMPERAKAWPSSEAYERMKSALEGYRRELPEKMQLFMQPPDDLPAAVAVGQRQLRVAVEAAKAYRLRKRRHGVVDFEDLLVKARDLLRDHPEVRERLQRRIRFLLIDELQDTDPVQMELVEYLVGAGLTQGKLFAVGDHKQSIYRFRRADVRLFQGLRRQVPHEGRLGLTRNFRSQPALLDFANALLGPLSFRETQAGTSGTLTPLSGLQDYEPLQPHHAQVNPGPCVEFLWAPREEKENVTEARTREADWIARRVAAMVARREALVVERAGGEERLRPVRPGDVVLLFRSMSNVELYESAMRRHGLDYYLVGGRAFFAQQEIYDLLNLLRALENPQDAVSLAGTLRSPFCCLSDEALFVLGRHPEGLWAGLHDPAALERLPAGQRARCERALINLDRWHALKDRLPIAGLLNEVFADSGYDAATQFEFLGDRKLANLWKLVDMARSFDRSGLFGLAEFIRRLGDLVRTQPREEQAATQPENADVVRLMTIHQAKGLEFPIVVVPDLAAAAGGARHPVAVWDPRLGCVARPPADDPPPFTDFGWRVWEAGEAIETWREDLRTLYVACTRAQDYLLLSAALADDFTPQTTWMLTLAERFDLRSGLWLVSGIPDEKVPRVRVTDRLAPPPETTATAPKRRTDVAFPDPPSPVAPRTASGTTRIVPLGELERVPDSSHNTMELGQWGAEDGSDRAAWQLPRERVECLTSPQHALRDRILRSVLAAWDYQDAAGWRPLLKQSLAAEPDADAALQEELAESLRRFAASALPGRLAAAADRLHDVEFLLPSPSCPQVQMCGVIDCAWQDEAGKWHVLTHETARREEMGGELRCILAALAVERLMGRWAASLWCYCWAEGKPVKVTATPQQARQALEAACVWPSQRERNT